VRVDEACVGIGSIAFKADTFVPVVKRGRALFPLDDIEPGVLPRRLVEVAVDDDKDVLDWSPPFLRYAFPLRSRL
jgi:hypothetical protein